MKYWPALVALAGVSSYFIIPEHLSFFRKETVRTPSSLEQNELAKTVLNPRAPVICENFYERICRLQRGTTRDPTGLVKPDLEGELEALRIYQELIRQHPDWSSQEVDAALVQAIYTPKRRERVIAAFKWAQFSVIKLIKRESAFASANKKLLIEKLRQVRVELPPPAALYADEPDLFTKNDVIYERLASGGVRLRVGGAFLFTSKSWFNMVFTFAHELAHSIDPCEIRDTGGNIPVFKKLENCFLKQKWIDNLSERTACSQNDQLSEVFADWLAVKVSAEALKEYATEYSRPQIIAAAVNSVRDLCEQEQSLDEVDNRQHPAALVRIESIFGGSPEIRKVLGCEPVPVQDSLKGLYCAF